MNHFYQSTEFLQHVAVIVALIVAFYFLLVFRAHKKYDPNQACRNDCTAIKVRLAACESVDQLNEAERAIDAFFEIYMHTADRQVLGDCYSELRVMLSKMQNRVTKPASKQII